MRLGTHLYALDIFIADAQWIDIFRALRNAWTRKSSSRRAIVFMVHIFPSPKHRNKRQPSASQE
jgi:hypothetical protein